MTSTYISVGEPIGQAWQKMMKVCFRPFAIGKWFCLGFCAWLAMLGESGGFNGGGGGGGGGGGPSGGGRGGAEPLAHARDWALANLVLVVVLVTVVLILAIGLGLLLAWLRARGKFMFLDGIVHDRGLVVQPWKEFREQANSLFIFNVVFGLIGFFAILLCLGGALLIALPDFHRGELGVAGVVAIIVGVLSIMCLALVIAVITACLEAFVVPLMYLRRQGVMAAWREFRTQMMPGHVGAIVLFFLMQIVLAFASGVAVLAAGVLTCCIGCCVLMLPYLGTVAVLPVLVFARSYAIYFFQQFGPQYQLMPVEQPLPPMGGYPVIMDQGPRPGPGSGPVG